MTKRIISANYRNRDSEYRWLVRKAGDSPESAVACKRVAVHGQIKFVKSSQLEEGFGCRVVGETDAVVVTIDEEPPKLNALKFNGYDAFEVEVEGGTKTVSSVDFLILNADGSMLAAV